MSRAGILNEEAIFNAVKAYKEAVGGLKNSGRFCFLVLLAIIPGLCMGSVTLRTIRIRAREIIRCKIDQLENGTWSWEEIQKISLPDCANALCYINDYDYEKFVNVSFENAKKIRNETNLKKPCPQFVRRVENFANTYCKEFLDYCKSLENEIYYDVPLLLSFFLSSIFIVPLADIIGRKQIFSLGCQLTVIAIFLKFMEMYFVRGFIGDVVMYLAFPLLKYTTQATIFEVADNKLRVFGFVLVYMGDYIPSLVFPLLPVIYWKLTTLITFSVCLLLPLPSWYFPESPLWVLSKNQPITAALLAKTLDNPVEHNELVLKLKNKVTRHENFQFLFGGILKTNRIQVALIMLFALCIGYLSLFSFTRHKLTYVDSNHFMENLMEASGLVAILLVLPCIYFVNRVKIILISILLINEIMYCAIATFEYNYLQPLHFTRSLLLVTHITTTMLQIFYEVYLNEYFPTTRRCTFLGIYGAISQLGLLFIIFLKLKPNWINHVISFCVCLVGCILTLFLKKLRRFSPLIIEVDDIEFKNPPEMRSSTQSVHSNGVLSEIWKKLTWFN